MNFTTAAFFITWVAPGNLRPLRRLCLPAVPSISPVPPSFFEFGSGARVCRPGCSSPTDRSLRRRTRTRDGAQSGRSAFSQRARELGFKYEPDELLEGQAACDFFVMSACEYADRNLLPFFRRWHFPCSTIAIRYMKQFRELGENEQFWTSYDGSTEPSFETRTPNKTITRPSCRLKFDMEDADDKLNWYLRGVAWDYNAYNDPVNPRCDTVVKKDGTKFIGNSIANPAWKNVFDGNTSNMNGLLGHMQPETGSMWAHIPFYILNFTGPGEDTPEDDDFEYSQEPVTFNTFALWNVANYYFTSYIYDIQYYDDADGVWKPTVPSEFKLLYNSNWEFYYFEQEYTTTKIQFKLQPITPGTSGYSITQMCEMSFGLVEEKTE